MLSIPGPHHPPAATEHTEDLAEDVQSNDHIASTHVPAHYHPLLGDNRALNGNASTSPSLRPTLRYPFLPQAVHHPSSIVSPDHRRIVVEANFIGRRIGRKGCSGWMGLAIGRWCEPAWTETTFKMRVIGQCQKHRDESDKVETAVHHLGPSAAKKMGAGGEEDELRSEWKRMGMLGPTPILREWRPR